MGPFSNDPASTGNSQAAQVWGGQAAASQSQPQQPTSQLGWAAQAAAQPQPSTPAPAWAGQPGVSQNTPAWVSQSGTPKPTLLDRAAGWPALRLIARWLKIVSWVELVLGVLVALVVGTSIGSIGVTLSQQGGTGAGTGAGLVGLVLTLYLLIVTAVGFILTYASAELILVFLTIEKNTRKNE